MNYSEEFKDSNSTKSNYVNGFERLISSKQEQALLNRDEFCKKIFDNPELYREELKKLLGWPLVDYSEVGLAKVKKTKLSANQH